MHHFRRTALLAFVAVFSFSVFSSSRERLGTSSGGGGSVTPPTPQEIKTTVHTLMAYSNAAHNQEIVSARSKTVNGDSDLMAILRKMAEDRDGFIKNFAQTHYYFKSHGPCHGIDGNREAAVGSNTMSATICFSLEWIAAGMPKVTLKESLNPLIMHEVAHQYGADEVLAKKVETVFSSALTLSDGAVTAFGETYYNIGNRLAHLDRALTQNGTDAELCSWISEAAGLARALDHQGGHLPDEDWNTDASMASSLIFDGPVSVMTEFCRINKYDKDPLTLGDRNGLRQALAVVEGLYQKLGQAVKKDFDLEPYDPGKDDEVTE